VRDPHRKVVDEQLNGGEIVPPFKLTGILILPYLMENEKLFGISVENDLLVVKGQRNPFQPRVYPAKVHL